LGSAFSNAGGVGGGGLNIAILILIFRFDTYEAIPISKISIFLGAIFSFIFNLQLKHPYRKAIAIDYNIPLITIPMLLFGTILGVSFIKVLPSYITLLLMSLILFYITFKTFRKANRLYQEEKKTEKILELRESSNFDSNDNDIYFDSNKKMYVTYNYLLQIILFIFMYLEI
jgi:uncharacterized membrane protein YfcA